MRISVITVNRNNVNGLRKTIESVVTQTVPPFEFIVIDGASTDGSASLLEEYASSITYSVSEPDNGIYPAMNKGIAQAHGDYCIFMNSGDCFCDEHVLEKVGESAARADIICGDSISLEDPPVRKKHPEEITFRFLFESSICHQAAFIGRELLAEGYDERLRFVSDRKFFFQQLILGNCTYAHIPVDIVHYDINGMSSAFRMDSEMEWQGVLDSLLPERILLDYGRHSFGELYGTGSYEQLFREIGRRKWRRPVYRMVRHVLSIVGSVVASARFVRRFPKQDE